MSKQAEKCRQEARSKACIEPDHLKRKDKKKQKTTRKKKTTQTLNSQTPAASQL